MIVFEGLRSVGLIIGLMNTDVSKQFRDQCSAIVVLTLRAGGFLRASVFYFSLIPRFSLSLCVRSGHAHLDSMGFKSLLMSFRKTERNSLLAWTAVIRVTPFFPSCWSCRFLPVWEFHHKLCSEGLSDAVKHHTLVQTQHTNTHTYISSGNESQFWSLLRLARSFFH